MHLHALPHAAGRLRDRLEEANKGINDWTEFLAGDEVLATVILERLLHHSQVINIKGRSYRLRDIEQTVTLRH